MNWYFEVLKKYAEFNGRARRTEYWMFTLFSTIVSVLLTLLDTEVLGLYDYGVDTVYSFAVFIPTLAVGVRRMHDVGKSGWYSIIPIYNLVLACTNGDEGTNEYGEDPKMKTNEIDEIGIPQE